MQLLSDVGLCGMRFDLLYGLGPVATRSIMTKAKAAGMFPPPYSFGYAELDQPLEDLAKYGALMPAHDHPLHFSLTKCLTLKPDGWGELDQTELPSISTLIAPKGLGNFTSATFSVNHDQYPQVSTGTANLRGFYSESKDPENVADTILSQLSMAYLCAKRDGNPHVLRFEDERDHKKLIQRSLAFRVLMERQTAPHEYMVDLGHDVLLIARQYGFVLINRGKQAHNITGDNLQSLVKANNNFAVYLPGLNSTEGVVYDELSGLGSTSQTYNSSQSYTLSSAGFNTLFSVDPMDAKFLILRNTAGQAAFDVTFTTSCSTTGLGDLIFVVGNHPLLGNWSPRADCLNGLLCTQFGSDPAGLFPKWTSLPLRFPKGTSLEYKYVIAYAGTDKKIKTWESGTDFTVPEKKKKTKSQSDVVHTQVQPQKLLNRVYTVLSDGTAPVEPASLWPVTESNLDTNNTGTYNNTSK